CFFFSSRRRHTRWPRDWSSDVCSSDLDARPVFEVVESPGGLYIGARRNAEEGKYYWRITQWVMPSFTMIAPRGNHAVHGHFWIQIGRASCRERVERSGGAVWSQ